MEPLSLCSSPLQLWTKNCIKTKKAHIHINTQPLTIKWWRSCGCSCGGCCSCCGWFRGSSTTSHIPRPVANFQFGIERGAIGAVVLVSKSIRTLNTRAHTDFKSKQQNTSYEWFCWSYAIGRQYRTKKNKLIMPEQTYCESKHKMFRYYSSMVLFFENRIRVGICLNTKTLFPTL